MLAGESKKLRDWVRIVEKSRQNFCLSNSYSPDCVGIDQEFYIELCAAAGRVIKRVNDMKIIVRWGESSVE